MAICMTPGCKTALGPGRLVCALHWSMLPAYVRRWVSDKLIWHERGAARVILNDFYQQER